jgi:hypothetical protein
MWNLFNCYLSGRHEYGVWCEPGTIFLRCVHCGKRSQGWSVQGAPVKPLSKPLPQPVPAKADRTPTRVLPFDRAVAG